MRKLFYLLTLLLLTSCLGDNSTSSYTYDGVVIHSAVVNTNNIAFDAVNVAMRFSFLMKEAGSFSEIETKTVTYNSKEKLAREVLFGSAENCTIEKIDADTVAITYHENYSLSGDNSRFGTIFINVKEGDNLFETNAQWSVSFSDGKDGYNMPKVGDFYYGQSTVSLYGGSSAITATGVCKAYKINAVSSDTPASWQYDMTMDFGSRDYSFTDITQEIELSYDNFGYLVSNPTYYSQETSENLIYIASCSKSGYISGVVSTYKGGDMWNPVKVETVRSSGTSCSYLTYVTYNGYTEMW